MDDRNPVRRIAAVAGGEGVDVRTEGGAPGDRLVLLAGSRLRLLLVSAECEGSGEEDDDQDKNGDNGDAGKTMTTIFLVHMASSGSFLVNLQETYNTTKMERSQVGYTD